MESEDARGEGAEAEHEAAEWLADKTGAPLEEVERELDEGARRRDFVVNELVEAGVTGPELLDLVVRLTGVDEAAARDLIAAEEREKRG
jgi:hypothetical protein